MEEGEEEKENVVGRNNNRQHQQTTSMGGKDGKTLSSLPGRLCVVGSSEIFSDEWLDKEENAQLCDMLFSWLLRKQSGGKGNETTNQQVVDFSSERVDVEHVLREYLHVPAIQGLASNPRPCLQVKNCFSFSSFL